MFQEETFVFNRKPDPDHYMMWLSLGLVTYCFCYARQVEKHARILTSFVVPIGLVAGFFASLRFDVLGFFFATAMTMTLICAAVTPINAVASMTILYICRPWEVITGSEWLLQIPRWCIWIWLLVWLLRNLQMKNLIFFRSLSSRGFVYMVLMAGWALLSIVASRNMSGSLQDYINTLFRAVFLVFVIGLTVRTRNDVHLLSAAFVIGVATLSVCSLWRFEGFDQLVELPSVGSSQQEADRRLEAFGSLGNSNDIAAVAMIPLGFVVPLIFSSTTGLLVRITACAAFLMTLKTILASQSRGALLAACAQIGIFLVIRSRNPKKVMLILIAGIGLFAPFVNQVMGRNADDLDASTESRMNYYVTGLRMALYSPVFGQGFGRYPYEFERYSTATLHEWGLRTAHSSWILVLSETGFVGLVIFFTIHLRMFRICWTLRRDCPGLLLALTGYTFTVIFLSHSWLMFPWILFTLIEMADLTETRGGTHHETDSQGWR